MLLLTVKISIKKIILKMEKHIRNKFPEYDAKFYSNRRNSCIHIGLDKAIFSYSHFKTLLEEVTSFLDEHIPNTFSSNFPKLIHSTKQKFDYILAIKKINDG